MAAQYATKEEAGAFTIEFGALPVADQNPIILAASRMVDRLSEVAEDFFDVASDTATPRTFYGNGTAFLELDPYNDATEPTIVMETGYDEPVWIEQGAPGAQFLVINEERKAQDTAAFGSWANRHSGWPDRVSVTVTAKWGFAAIPDEVRAATIELAVHMWRKADPSRMITEGGTSSIAGQIIPPNVELITNELRARYSRKAVFA